MAGDDAGASMPPDPMSQLAAGAAQLHEFYVSLLAAGFTDRQALYLTGQAMMAGVRPDAPERVAG